MIARQRNMDGLVRATKHALLRGIFSTCGLLRGGGLTDSIKCSLPPKAQTGTTLAGVLPAGASHGARLISAPDL